MINKVRSTQNELTSTYSRLTTKAAFTMAEILLSLTIIGVVAAITLPSLTGNINERTWNTQRKALYARMSQAIALMPALNGYGSTVDNAAETFITSGLSKVLKINNICSYGDDGSKLFDCGFASQMINLAASKVDLPKKVSSLNDGIPITIPGTAITVMNTKAAAFETANGESILTFYNPQCTASNVIAMGASGSNPGVYIKQHVCANFIFDLNGKKGPNTLGKDIGIVAVIYSSDSNVVMPIAPRALSGYHKQLDASKECQKLEDNYRLPNIEEVLALYYNADLFGENLWGGFNWSSTLDGSSNAWGLGLDSGMKYSLPRAQNGKVFCVQR